MRLTLRYTLVLVRLYFGAWMLLNGLNHFLPVFPQPMGGALKSSQLMVTLIETGLLGLVKSTEILVGLLLLVDWFVPLALVMALPVSVVVWFNHAVLGGKPFDISMGIGCLVWNVVLLLAYFRYYLPMLRADTRIGALADLAQFGDVLRREPAGDAPESQHRFAALLVGVIITAVVWYRLHPSSEQPAGSGQTPARIVTDYMQLAYAQNQKHEADARYLSPQLASREAAAVLSGVQPLHLSITEVIGQGSSVAVYSHATAAADGAVFDVVDVFQVARSLIVAHTRVAQRATGLAGTAG